MLGRRQFSLAALSGVLLALSFPLPGFHYLAWLAAAPLVIASLDAGPGRAFALGCLAGAVWTACTLYWTYVYHALALFFAVGILSLYTGFFSLILNLAAGRRPKELLILLVPLAWTSVEYVKSLGYAGFPWNSLGYSQHLNLPLIQIAEYTGVFGVSFAVSAVSGGAAAAFFLRRTPRKAAAVLLTSLLLPVFLFFTGIRTIRNLPADDAEIRITAFQPSIHPEISWSEFGHVITASLAYPAAEEEEAEGGLFLAVFPETVIAEDLSAAFAEGTWLYDSLLRIIPPGAHMLIGAHYLEGGSLFNSAYLLSPDGNIAARYDKMKLVPGGEYLPFLRSAGPVRKMLRGAGGYTPGRERKVFRANGEAFSVLICFEGIFGNHARKFVRRGAGFLINITNDAWSMSRASHFQHASMASMRSVENRVWTVRVGNTGITRFINPAGETVDELAYWKRGYLKGSVSPRPARKTFYTRRGDVFSLAAAALLMMIGGLPHAAAKFRSRRGRNQRGVPPSKFFPSF